MLCLIDISCKNLLVLHLSHIYSKYGISIDMHTIAPTNVLDVM
jgi:hypothetical protein